MAYQHEEGCYENKYLHLFCLFAKGYRTTTSRWQGAPHFRRYGRELGFEPVDFVKETLEGLP